MNCKEVYEKIYSLVDNELSTFNKKQVMKHLENCKSCSEIYTQVMDMKNLISSEITLDDFEELGIEFTLIGSYSNVNEKNIVNKSRKLNSNWRYSFMRKKIIAASITVLLMVGTFVPVNGASLADRVSEWFRELTVNTEETEYIIATELNVRQEKVDNNKLPSPYQEMKEELIKEFNAAFQNTKTIEEKNKVVEDYDFKIQKVEKEAIGWAFDRFKTYTDAMNNIPYDFPIPTYIPDGYDFRYVQYDSTADREDTHIDLYYDKNAEIGKPVTIIVDYNFTKAEIKKRTINHQEGTEIKPLNILGYEGYISYLNSDDCYSLDAHLMVDKDDLKFINVSINDDEFNYRTEDDPEWQNSPKLSKEVIIVKYEQEVMKIAESILQSIDK